MQTFKNRNYTKRNYEATNIVACVAETAPETPDNRWEPTDDAILAKLTPLWIEGGVRFYGYL